MGFNGTSSRSLVDSGAESDVDCGAREAERERTLAAGRESFLQQFGRVWMLFTLVLRICLGLNLGLNFVGRGDLKTV